MFNVVPIPDGDIGTPHVLRCTLQPINEHSFVWGLVRLRSYLGYPPVRDAQPNTTHFALAALQYSSVVSKLITQNVDGLHHKAIAHVWGEGRMQERILELHGRLRVGVPHRGSRSVPYLTYNPYRAFDAHMAIW